MDNKAKNVFETPEIDITLFRKSDVILTESDPNDDLGGWSPDII